ncbi:MAG: helix-turn-helix transcriptional regulator [Oscillospiraceae bacterium]|nr:helix-turn-helix transcriptional regulator [Oscillospiraceae bacterium]
MLGTRIAARRRMLGISQNELARRLCISPSAVGMYEQGRREPSVEMLAALSQALDVSIDYLVTGRNWSCGDRCGNCPESFFPKEPDPFPISEAGLKRLLLDLLRDV